MTRLRVLVEGETEEDFVNAVLRDYLCENFGILATATGVGERHGKRGIVGWQSALRHIRNSLKEDSGLFVTTLVDYYALPPSWPGRTEAKAVPYDRRSAFMAEKISAALAEKIGDEWRTNRVIPFVLIHEFETLLFANPAKTARAVGPVELEALMASVLAQFDSPEEINDSPATAPSKQLEKIFQDNKFGAYDKRLHGNIAAKEIGLAELRVAWPQFGAWLTAIENLGTPA